MHKTPKKAKKRSYALVVASAEIVEEHFQDRTLKEEFFVLSGL
jgi:hypothetical protein